MLVNFTKMHGLGNDFVVIDFITQYAHLHGAHIKRIADRQFGIGCDQVILVEPPLNPDAHFFYRIFNPNGDEVEHCGNGARCAAKFAIDLGLVNKTNIIADYFSGQLAMEYFSSGHIKVEMFPWENKVQHNVVTLNEDLNLDVYSLHLGNPHGVIIVNDLSTSPIESWGKFLSEAKIFAEGANISFMQIINKDRIRIRTYERGAGLTWSCGSGACAAVVVGYFLKLLNKEVIACFPHGELKVNIDTDNKKIFQSGPASSIFVGRFRL